MPRLLPRKECLRRGKHLENGGIMEEEEEEEEGGVEWRGEWLQYCLPLAAG